MLRVEDLWARANGKLVLRGVNLEVKRGETCVIFGPNGSGKTTLLHTIMGFPGYAIEKGKVLFEGKELMGLSTDERARLGIALGLQQPPELKGIKLRGLLEVCVGRELREEDMELVRRLHLFEFLERDVNLNFSGGERKRCEVLQTLMLKPKLLMLDEPDSGVDFESLAILGKEIQTYLSASGASAIIVTHHGEILKHVRAGVGYVMVRGELVCCGSPERILEDIASKGYEGCVECL